MSFKADILSISSPFHSEKGPMLETSAFELLIQRPILFTLSTHLIILNSPILLSLQHSITISLKTYPRNGGVDIVCRNILLVFVSPLFDLFQDNKLRQWR